MLVMMILAVVSYTQTLQHFQVLILWNTPKNQSALQSALQSKIGTGTVSLDYDING